MYILIFTNTHRAMECEKILYDLGLDFEILPAPSYITKSCGICISVCKKDFIKIKEFINKGKILISSIYDESTRELINLI